MDEIPAPIQTDAIKEEDMKLPQLVSMLVIVMTAMAANSSLSRAGIDTYGMNPLAFCGIRLASGALLLAALVLLTSSFPKMEVSRIYTAFWLLVNVIPFSMALKTLPAGVGTLIVFAIVQITMFVGAAMTGTHPSVRQWIGMCVAMGGLVWLLYPKGDFKLDMVGVAFMALAGVGWGMFCLRGKGAKAPLADMAISFIACIPVAIVLCFVSDVGRWSSKGVLMASTCGSLTSGLGYALWYHLLPKIAITTASVAQLCVPLIAMALGAIFLGEKLTLDIVISSTIVLGGIAMSINFKCNYNVNTVSVVNDMRCELVSQVD